MITTKHKRIHSELKNQFIYFERVLTDQIVEKKFYPPKHLFAQIFDLFNKNILHSPKFCNALQLIYLEMTKNLQELNIRDFFIYVQLTATSNTWFLVSSPLHQKIIIDRSYDFLKL